MQVAVMAHAVDLGGQQLGGLVVAKGREGHVQWVRHQPAHFTEHELGKDVGVHHVPLTENGKAGVQGQRPLLGHQVQHDVAADALLTKTTLCDGLGQLLVRERNGVGCVAGPQGGE